jgi:hypothetical protein
MARSHLESLKCTNHKADRTVVSSARLDLENPCTWCSNRKDAGPTGKAFYYRQFKRWEFPHIAETNCGNYSVIVRPTPGSSPSGWATQTTLQKERDRIRDVDASFEPNWGAFDPREVPEVKGVRPEPRKVKYPADMSGAEFEQQLSELLGELAEMRKDLRDLTDKERQRTGIVDDKLEGWIATQELIAKEKREQIAKVEKAAATHNVLGLVSVWAYKNLTGNAVWDSIKWVKDVVWATLQGGHAQ